MPVSNQKLTKMSEFLLNAKSNWKTTLGGIASILSVVASYWVPALVEPVSQTVAILAGLGLIAAKDK